MSETADNALKGAALIKDEVKRLPDAPGVYRMMGEDGEVLYVGKAAPEEAGAAVRAGPLPHQPHRPHGGR
jgi:hypothetical protein